MNLKAIESRTMKTKLNPIKKQFLMQDLKIEIKKHLKILKHKS